ncbi:hypothetical protein BK022_10420 [Methylorubrum extorquens]|uniref:Uncharacterized protein n=1 Tax=Methylorubrum extorquens TaxID=408 RepID=A0A1S1P6G0_METEX|nr:hypothetical protein BK022_10420 [Methylorubrum extorquens]
MKVSTSFSGSLKNDDSPLMSKPAKAVPTRPKYGSSATSSATGASLTCVTVSEKLSSAKAVPSLARTVTVKTPSPRAARLPERTPSVIVRPPFGTTAPAAFFTSSV